MNKLNNETIELRTSLKDMQFSDEFEGLLKFFSIFSAVYFGIMIALLNNGGFYTASGADVYIVMGVWTLITSGAVFLRWSDNGGCDWGFLELNAEARANNDEYFRLMDIRHKREAAEKEAKRKAEVRAWEIKTFGYSNL